MVTPSDPYGDLSVEDLFDDDNDPIINIDSEKELDFDELFEEKEIRSYEEDFGNELDEVLGHMETDDPEWSDEFTSEIEAQEYFERIIERTDE